MKTVEITVMSLGEDEGGRCASLCPMGPRAMCRSRILAEVLS